MARLFVDIKDFTSLLCLLTMLFVSTSLAADGPHDGSSPAKASAPGASKAALADSDPPASQAAKTRVVGNYGNLPLSFEANQGQTDSEVRFLSRGKGYTLFLT